VGYNKDRESALVQVKDITYNEGVIEYHLGMVLEKVDFVLKESRNGGFDSPE